ncbi:hypothetical protein KC345_g10392 [Hortaea werneckii]|nr:hypothetical protein KC345_g10392 [Hortaea werneckii]
MGGWKDGDTEAGKPERPEWPGRITINTSGSKGSTDQAPEEKQQFRQHAADSSRTSRPEERLQPVYAKDTAAAGYQVAADPADLPQEEKLNALYRMTTQLAQQMEKSRISEYTELLHSPFRLIWLNIFSGVARGLGIALGFTFFAATIIYVLQVLGALNLPIIGDYIADIVRIVQHQLELKTF